MGPMSRGALSSESNLPRRVRTYVWPNTGPGACVRAGECVRARMLKEVGRHMDCTHFMQDIRGALHPLWVVSSKI